MSLPGDTVDDLGAIADRYKDAAEPVWLWDADRRRVLWTNAPGMALFGAHSVFDLIEHVFAREAPEARLAHATGEGIEGAVSAGGAPVRVRADVSAVKLARAENARLVVVCEVKPPVAEPRLARRAALFEFAPVALVMVGLDGAIRDANAATTVVNGAKMERLADIVGEDVAARVVAQALAAGHSAAAAERHGRVLRVAGLRIADPVDGGAAVLARIEDVTARRDLETLMAARPAAPAAVESAPALGQANGHDAPADVQSALAARDEAERKSRMKSQFIAQLSHEMRNPLNAIIGFAEIMQQHHFGPLGDRRYEAYAVDIRNSADHLLSLVEDLLDLARIEAGKLNLKFESVALGPLVAECARLLQPAASGYKVALSTEIGTLPPVLADARSLKQVLINLISNALKFTVAGGQVRVMAAARQGGGIVVAVSDTGVGMNPAELERAFEPFGQANGEHQSKRRGTGLGLPLAKALAEANKCAFEITSEPQKGTLVRLVFPPERVVGSEARPAG